MKPIPLKMGSPESYAKSFLDPVAGGWTFAGCPIEADFPISVDTIAPYAVDILDRLCPFDIRGVTPVVRIIGGQLALLDPEDTLSL